MTMIIKHQKLAKKCLYLFPSSLFLLFHILDHNVRMHSFLMKVKKYLQSTENRYLKESNAEVLGKLSLFVVLLSWRSLERNRDLYNCGKRTNVIALVNLIMIQEELLERQRVPFFI